MTFVSRIAEATPSKYRMQATAGGQDEADAGPKEGLWANGR